jgi:hypothetical protein
MCVVPGDAMGHEPGKNKMNLATDTDRQDACQRTGGWLRLVLFKVPRFKFRSCGSLERLRGRQKRPIRPTAPWRRAQPRVRVVVAHHWLRLSGHLESPWQWRWRWIPQLNRDAFQLGERDERPAVELMHDDAPMPWYLVVEGVV